jgi:hypothetical protein
LDSSGELVESDTNDFSWEESLKTAIHCGVSIKEWEQMTPYELALICEVWAEQKEAENITKITMVWLGEYYHRIKKLPPIKKAVDDVLGGKKKTMSDEEMLEKVKSLNAMFGGIEIKEPIENEPIREENEIDSIHGGID